MVTVSGRRFLPVAAWFLVVALGGCDGTSPSSNADGAWSSGGRGGSAAGGSDGSVRVPALHRAAGSSCPAARGAGQICSFGVDAGANACLADSDCTAGTNGRCFSPNGPVPECNPTSCSYDDCSSDSDCPTHVPCLCRASAADSAANRCVAGGNCAVDADCGPGGYCSPGGTTDFCFTPIYFCHTPADTCVDNSDCPRSPSNYPQSCNYDPQSGHFACGGACVSPP